MLRYLSFFITSLLFTLLLAGCSSSPANTAESLLSQQADVTQAYVDALNGAESADDVVAAMEAFTDEMKVLVPKLKAFEKEHPGYLRGDKTTPKITLADQRLRTTMGEIPQAMSAMIPYMSDPKVRQALATMGKEASQSR